MAAVRCSRRFSSLTWKAGTLEQGDYLLRDVHVSGDGTEPLFRLGSTSPVRPDGLIDYGNIATFGVAGRRQFVALGLALSQPPYVGIQRIFIRPAEDARRARVVRH